jgi:antirestriction protein ArdC
LILFFCLLCLSHKNKKGENMAYQEKKSKKFVSVAKNHTEEPTDHHLAMTERVIEAMENAGKWSKPWFVCNQLPKNALTGENYNGCNLIALMSAGHDNPYFGTFLQYKELEKERQAAHKSLITLQSGFQSGEIPAAQYMRDKAKAEAVFEKLEKLGMVDRDQPIHVKAGQKGTAVFKAVKFSYVDKAAEGSDDAVEVAGENVSVKTYMRNVYAGTVFNINQVANMKAPNVPAYDFEPHAEAELHVQAMMAKTGLKLEHNDGGRAYYSVADHKITMPRKDRFVPGAYYDTLMHEIGHSTGPALGRDLSGKFGSASYAFEELVAELSSMFMAAQLGIPHDPATHENHAAYMKSWATAMKADKNMIFKAASKAQQSTDFQNFVRQEYKLENGLVNDNSKTVKTPSHITEKVRVFKKEKSLTMCM